MSTEILTWANVKIKFFDINLTNTLTYSQLLDAFTKNDLEFTAAVANEMSIAIDNSRLQQEAVQNERMTAIGMTITNIAHNIKNLLTINKGVEELGK